MGETGLFSGIGDVIDKVKNPPDLLLFLGIGLFGWGTAKGPFAMTNGMISWGLICMTAAMAVKLFSESVSWVGDTYSDSHFIHWWNIAGGLLFSLACLSLIFHQFAHHWVPFRKL